MYALKKEEIMKHHTPSLPSGVSSGSVFSAKDLVELVDTTKKIMKEHLDGVLEQTKIEKRMQIRQATALVAMLQIDQQLKQVMDEIKAIAEALLQAADHKANAENPIYVAYDTLHTLLEILNKLLEGLAKEDAIVKRIAQIMEQRKQKYGNLETGVQIVKRTVEGFTPELEFTHKIDISRELDGINTVADSQTKPIKEADQALVLGITELKRLIEGQISPQVVAIEMNLETIKKSVLNKKSAWDKWIDTFHRG